MKMCFSVTESGKKFKGCLRDGGKTSCSTVIEAARELEAYPECHGSAMDTCTSASMPFHSSEM